MIIPIILSGGSGTRLWPLSRKSNPKQFINLINGESLFQKTVKRFLNNKNFADILTICNKSHKDFIQNEFDKLNIKNSKILVEPVGRDTASAITAVSFFAQQNCNDDVVLILPSDHLIKEVDKFIEYVLKGQKLAEKGYFVTFGIVPTRPETGYGYIKRGKKFNSVAFDVERFVEKPDLATAWRFLEDKHYSWNSGIFMFKPSLMLKNIKEFERNIYDSCKKACKNSAQENNFYYLNKEDFEKCNVISIDFAVFERTKDKIVVIPMDINWSDLGHFESLYESEANKDEHGNISKGNVILEDVKDSYIRCESGDKLIAVVGLKDIVVVQTADALLVLNKEKAQSVRGIIQQLKASTNKDDKNLV